MSKTELNCCVCGKELGLGNRVSSDGVLWRCEDCAMKQREEYDNKDKTIADLKSKLAEKEEKVNKQWFQIQADTEHIQRLKQQLTEKDRQIEQLKKFDDLNKTFFDLFRTAFKEPNKVDDLFNALKTMQEKQDQDKISFCIEKLEKLRNEITPIFCVPGGIYSNLHNEVFKIIDNQIKQLKEGK